MLLKKWKSNKERGGGKRRGEKERMGKIRRLKDVEY
jgi:hypothetical protein